MKRYQTWTLCCGGATSTGVMLTLVLAPTAAMGLGVHPGPIAHRQPAVIQAPYRGRSLGVDGSANAVEHRLLLARLSRSSSSANAEEHRLASR